jgi:hypothetical protein
MKTLKWFLFIFLFLPFNLSCDADKDIINWCPIKMDKAAMEARFFAFYKFTVRDSRPENITKVRNPILDDDDDFIKCISGWVLPSIKGEGGAEFLFEHGLTEITVYGKGFKKVVARDSKERRK